MMWTNVVLLQPSAHAGLVSKYFFVAQCNSDKWCWRLLAYQTFETRFDFVSINRLPDIFYILWYFNLKKVL